MKTKLTLRLDDEMIGRAKAYAARRGTSVSALVEDYFRLLVPLDPAGAAPGGASPADDGAGGDAPSGEASGEADTWRARLSPGVRELLGSARPPASGASAPAVPEDPEEAYRAYLAEKYR